VDVNVADVSCVSGERLHAVINHRCVRCHGRTGVTLDVYCLSGGLRLVLLCAGRWHHCADGGL
jgi:hypothetical protein